MKRVRTPPPRPGPRVEGPYSARYIDPGLSVSEITDFLNLQWNNGWDYVDGLAMTPRRMEGSSRKLLRLTFKRRAMSALESDRGRV